MCELTDEDTVARKDGIIALQIHAGPPMKVQFRNIRLKEFKSGGRAPHGLELIALLTLPPSRPSRRAKDGGGQRCIAPRRIHTGRGPLIRSADAADLDAAEPMARLPPTAKNR